MIDLNALRTNIKNAVHAKFKDGDKNELMEIKMFANKIGVTPALASYWINQMPPQKISVIAKICDVCEIKLADLIIASEK